MVGNPKVFIYIIRGISEKPTWVNNNWCTDTDFGGCGGRGSGGDGYDSSGAHSSG